MLGRGRGVAVHGVDRGLELVRARAGCGAGMPGRDRLALGDQRAVPPAAVLVGEQHQRAVGRGAGRPARLGEQQQGEQARATSGSSGISSASSRARRMASAHRSARMRSSPVGGRVALVEDEVDDRQHRRRAGRAARRRAGHGRGCWRRGSCASPARAAGPSSASGTRKARAISSVSSPPSSRSVSATWALGGERRVAAGEDQAEAVVVHRSHLRWLVVGSCSSDGLGVAVVA